MTIDRSPVTAYAAVCGFPVKDTVPLTYPHLLAFPLHLAILTDPSFPFPAVGAVHLTNSITGHRPVAVGETVTVTTRAAEVRPHPKGRTVDVVTSVDAAGRGRVGEHVDVPPPRSVSVGGACRDHRR